MSRLPSPLLLFRTVAVLEALSWAGLLGGMYFKYLSTGPLAGEWGVHLFGPVHGAFFLAYCAVTLLVGLRARWPLPRLLLGLACAVPPFTTLWFDRYAEGRGLLPGSWRNLRETTPSSV